MQRDEPTGMQPQGRTAAVSLGAIDLWKSVGACGVPATCTVPGAGTMYMSQWDVAPAVR